MPTPGVSMLTASTQLSSWPSPFTLVNRCLQKNSVSETNKSDRTVPMQVLALGMGRTGTASMQAALEKLGCGPAYHGFTPLFDISHNAPWIRAFEAKYHGNGISFTREDWDSLLGSYGAVTDIPSICFAPELIEAYPEAKVVLVERDIDTWYSSFNQGLIEPFYMPIHTLLSYLDPQMLRKSYVLFRYVFRDRMGFFRAETKVEAQRNAAKIYREHYTLVRKITPKDRLLNFNLKDAWGPLCEFLEKEVPDEPFPHLNDADALAKLVSDYRNKSLRNVLRNLIGLGVGLGMVKWVLQS